MSNKLAAKVRAVNAANQRANELYSTLAEIFRPLVGTQIIKSTSNTLFQRVEKLLPDFPYTKSMRVYKSVANYSISFTANACEMIDDTCCLYHEATVYIGNLRDGVLLNLYDFDERRTDYTVEAIEEARAKYAAAKKIASDLQSALFPFGEY